MILASRKPNQIDLMFYGNELTFAKFKWHKHVNRVYTAKICLVKMNDISMNGLLVLQYEVLHKDTSARCILSNPTQLYLLFVIKDDILPFCTASHV